MIPGLVGAAPACQTGHVDFLPAIREEKEIAVRFLSPFPHGKMNCHQFSRGFTPLTMKGLERDPVREGWSAGGDAACREESVMVAG
jgi:hypothetical protein